MTGEGFPPLSFFPQLVSMPEVNPVRPIIIRPELIPVAGDIVVAILLSQIHYWHNKDKKGKVRLRVLKVKKLWIAKTREKWMAETGLTLKQYRRAIIVLRQKGLIEVRQMDFKGLSVSHIRLIPQTPPEAQGPLQPAAPEAHCSGEPTGLTPEVQRLQTEITDRDSGGDASRAGTGETNEELQEERRDPEPEEERTQLDEVTVDVLANDGKIEADAMKATDVLHAHTTGKVEGSIHTFWQKRMELVTEKFQGGLTNRAKGQLSQLQKKLGPDMTRAVIDYALNNWWKFASRAGTGAGVTYPTVPTLDFLIKYYAVAAQLLQSSAVVPIETGPSPPADAPQGIVETPPPDDAEKPHILTQEELDAMLEGLEG